MNPSPSHLHSSHNTNSSAIFLTGFGPFAYITQNPTQQIVRSLTPEELKKFGIEEIAVLNVSCKSVDNWIASVKQKADKIAETKPVWFIHLGVGDNTIYQLQQHAYNNKDLVIPDNDGYQCRNKQICQVLKLQDSIQSSANLSSICKDLTQCHQIRISQDPGRFLCNYIYFKSLNDLSSKNPKINSLFIHIPESYYSTLQQNRDFILNVLSWLHRDTICNSQGCSLK